MARSDRNFMRRAVELALESEAQGNLPVGAVVVLDSEIVGRGKSSVLDPVYHPGRHAEIEALKSVDPELWPRARQMTCFSTLEPCVMCAGTLLLHGIGRVVFGATDELGGASSILDHLPAYYDDGGVYEWVGPILPKVCRPLYRRADAAFASLPVGRDTWTSTQSPRQELRDTIDVLEKWAESKSGLTRARKAAAKLVKIADTSELRELAPHIQALFESTGYLKDYRVLKKVSELLDDPRVLDDVDAAVRTNLPDLWIKSALDRGSLNDAIECWYEMEGHRRLRHVSDRLIELCGKDDPELLVSARMSVVEHLIGKTKRKHYRFACAALRKLRDELEAIDHVAYWLLIIDDLADRYQSRSALLDEFRRAGFVP